MSIAEPQLIELLDKLLSNTKRGQLTWAESAASGRFQARSGDFVIYLDGDPNAFAATNALTTFADIGSISNVTLTIKKLNGKTIHEIDGNMNTLSSVLGRSSSSPQLTRKISELYSLISSRDNDIDELLKSLG